MAHLVSITQLERNDLDTIIDVAEGLLARPRPDALRGRVMVSMFFEPSTRTRLSFESAALRLGAGVTGFSDAASTSTKKGESLEDTVRMCMAYGDVLVIRHPEVGSAARAAHVSMVPVLNGGDGPNEHPTQTLTDLFTIKKAHGRVDGLHIAFAGDLLYGRTVHSLLGALTRYKDVTVHLIASPRLALPESHRRHATLHGVDLCDEDTLESAIPKLDILYMTRIQKERIPDEEANLTRSPQLPYRLEAAMLKHAKPTLRIMHPLPRVDELATDVDATPHALYFTQAANAVVTRQAVLLRALGV